jgi:hypothetical protein
MASFALCLSLLSHAHSSLQGCQIFLDTIYQMGIIHMTNDHKMFRTVINMSKVSIQRHSQTYQNWVVWV